jgi:Flp pilus assembly protein TadD
VRRLRAADVAWRAAAALGAAVLVAAAGAQSPQGPSDEARRRNNLGVALMDAGTKDPKYFVEAVREFEAALELAPRYGLARVNLGLALYYGGQTARASTVLQEVSRESPGNLHAEYVSGLLREYEAQFDQAATHFRRVTAADSSDPDAWYHLGFCLGKAGRAKEAVEPLRRAAALLPYQRRVRYALYMTLTRAGQAAEAQQELDRFRALDTSQIRVVEGPKNTLEYLKQGRYAEVVADSRATADRPRSSAFVDVTREAGLPPTRGAAGRTPGAGAAFVDLDKDGRLDLAWLRNGALAVFAQRAPGRFSRVTTPTLAPVVTAPTALAAADLDNDGWPDLVVGGTGRLAVLRNRNGRLQPPSRLAPPLVARAQPIAALGLADLDHDGDLDLVAAGGSPADAAGPRPANVVLRNNGDGTFADISRDTGLGDTKVGTRAFWFGDLDADNAVDVVAVDARGAGHAFINLKDGTFAANARAVPAVAPVPADEARAYGDYDGDGAADELRVAPDGVHLARGSTVPARWLRVSAAGYVVPGKVKSNTLGIGTKIEVRSAGRWDRREIRGGNGMGGTDAPEAIFDLGSDARLDFVRAVFPSGVRRTLPDVAANQAIRIEEPLLDVNSCPALFTWNGERFTFITDTLSAGILGELVAPGEYSRPDPDEWVRIEGPDLVPRGDRLEIRFTNPLEETTYLDRVRLVAVDHPVGVSAYSDDRMFGDPANRAPVRLLALRDARPIASAVDHHGHDVASRLAREDRRYFDDFAPRPFKGFAGDWSLTIDLGAVEPRVRTALGLDGWSYWNSSAAVIAATQAGETLWGPALDVLGPDGRWREATADLGLPAGLPRPVVIDLSPWLAPGEHVVRLRANRTIYVDRAWVATIEAGEPITSGRSPAGLRVTDAPLSGAEQRWLGYPRRTLPDGRLPEVFDYDHVEPQAEWRTASGLLTRYGDVTPLVGATDDRFAIMGHGEEIALSFDARSLPAVGPGWQRTWFFFADGYEKGSEFYSALGDTVAPLPWHAMAGYPSRTERPLDPGEAEYTHDWLTRPAFLRVR